MGEKLAGKLQDMRYELKVTTALGSMQSATGAGGRFQGAGDPRLTGGAALGY
ncbi:MAG: hypothetical protein OXC97_06820 [Candidatus Dadabacteria bacterium]|nr:hypothetical protein [Candidatus Dadabacteria bacterium]